MTSPLFGGPILIASAGAPPTGSTPVAASPTTPAAAAGAATTTTAAGLPPQTDPGTGHGPEWGEAAPIGLLIILLMGGALYLLVKSMNRNLKRVPKTFEPDAKDPDGAPADENIGAGSPGLSEGDADRDVDADGTPDRESLERSGGGPASG